MKLTKENLLSYLLNEGYEVIPEFKFSETRKFRADFKVIKGDNSVLVEYEGINPSAGFWTIHKGKRIYVYPSNGHTSAIGYTKDCEKYTLAAKCGYHVLRYTPLNLNDILKDLKEYFESCYKQIKLF